MKRFLAFFVALLLAFSTVGVCFSAFAAEIGGTNELGNFTDALLELVRTYDAPAYAPEQGEAAAETELKQKLPMTYDKDFFSPHEFAASHYDAVANDGDEEMPDSTFASKRLIVKSEKRFLHKAQWNASAATVIYTFCNTKPKMLPETRLLITNPVRM